MALSAAASIGLGIGGLLTGSVASLVGSYWEGEISEAQFEREMAFRERQLDNQISFQAEQLGISEKRMQQQWQQFLVELKESKRQFNLGYGLKKESLEHQKFMDLVQPTIERNRRSKNLLTTFSNLKDSFASNKPATSTPSPSAGANPLTAAPSAPSAPAQNPASNPLAK